MFDKLLWCQLLFESLFTLKTYQDVFWEAYEPKISESINQFLDFVEKEVIWELTQRLEATLSQISIVISDLNFIFLHVQMQINDVFELSIRKLIIFTLVDHLYGIVYVMLQFCGFFTHFLYLCLCLWWISSKERRYAIDQSLGLFPDIWQSLTKQLLKVIPVLEF